MRLFGKAKKSSSKKDTAKGTADSIRKLRGTLEMLEKTEKHLESKIDAQNDIARKMVKKNKRAAMAALKRKKAYEAQIAKISGAKMTIETQVMAIENANVSLEAMSAMKAGSDAMKAIHGKITIEKVDDTMEDIRDQMDIANEINEAISTPIGFGEELDEDELEAELEELAGEELESELLGAPQVGQGDLSTEPVEAVEEEEPEEAVDEGEEDELAELEAEMMV